MLKKITLIIFIFFLCISCNTPNTINIELLNGYWEIEEVKKDNTNIKTYSVNTLVDYFEIREDSSGFRKKVTPTLEGKYIVSDHQSQFILNQNQNRLYFQYNNDSLMKEYISELSSTRLIIKNSEGFSYTYKPFKSIDINYE